MKKRLSVLAALVLASLCVFASTTDSFIIPVSESEFYSDTYTLYSLLGLASPSYSQPWSGSEAEIILSRAEEKAGESEFTRNLLSSLESRLESYGPSHSISDGFSYNVGITASPEIYVHTNTEDYVNDNDWF